MIHSSKRLAGIRIEATNGEVGKVKDLYFDDAHWTVRYFVVDTGGWLTRRLGLISPIAVTEFDAARSLLRVKLTREQVEKSPTIDTDRPVSRQHEISLFDYYGYPYYWYGPQPWGAVASPLDVGPRPADAPLPKDVLQHLDTEKHGPDSHVRSANEVRGYDVETTEGAIGDVEDFLFDDRSWAIRYAVIDTGNWLPGRKVLIDPQWIDRVEWPAKKVHVKVKRADVERSPEYDPSATLSDDYQRRLQEHYLNLKRTFHE